MTKLGTPIGAGPKVAIVASGLAPVGAPPWPNCEPPSPPSLGGCTPAVAAGAATPPPEPPPPRLWLCLTPVSGSLGASEASRVAPLRTLPPPACRGGSASSPSAGVAGLPSPFAASSASSLVSSADSQSGSSRSMSPSSSSSTPLEQAGFSLGGATSEGVVERPWVACPSPRPVDGSAPAMPTPNAVTTANPASAMISASFCLMRSRFRSLRARAGPYPCTASPQASSLPKVLSCAEACNAPRRPPTCP